MFLKSGSCLIEIACFITCVNSMNLYRAEEYISEFQNFIRKYEKIYENNTEEYNKRLEIFKANYNVSMELNRQRTDNTSAWFGITKFSDLTFQEFKDVYLSDYIPTKVPHPPATTNLKMNNVFRHRITLPSKVDWREKGCVTKVKNQGTCGGCWAFSSVELLESRYAAQTGHLKDFSMQEVLDCSRGAKTPYGKLSGCEGGQLCAALYWLNKTQTPLVEEDKYQYKDKDQYCTIMPGTTKGVRVQDYMCRVFVNNEEGMLYYLATQGPISVAVDASNWHNYMGGIVQYHCATNLNHAVQVVGYDFTGPVPFYIVRNSWGEDWGLKGYMHVAYGRDMCGIAREVTMVTRVSIVKA